MSVDMSGAMGATGVKSDLQAKVYSYDEVPYDSLPFPQSHPDRLAVQATLFGVKPARIDRARVLELGCASGGNLIPMACTLPESEFVGVELSERQAKDAISRIEALGLTNIRILPIDLMNLPSDIGQFDYIITHGVYSWIPSPVQDKIMQICRDHLTPRGVAYISYNTYPGWHMRGMIREMMQFHLRQLKEPADRSAEALGLVDFLSEQAPVESSAFGIKPYQSILAEEAAFLRKQRRSYIIHEHLADTNEPLYFHQFMERAAGHGLRYLAEAELGTMAFRNNMRREAVERIQNISNDVLVMEQYMDFVRNRTFRQTLLCRQEIDVERHPEPEYVKKFNIASPARAQNPSMDIHAQERATFEFRGSNINVPSALVKAAFLHLQDIWPGSIPFDELLTVARSRARPAGIEEKTTFDNDAALLASDLIVGLEVNLVQLRTLRDSFMTSVSEYPRATPLARLQAQCQDNVTNQIHETVEIDSFSRHVLGLLDGQKTHAMLCDELARLAREGVLAVHKDGVIIRDQSRAREVIEPHLVETLEKLARCALLVG